VYNYRQSNPQIPDRDIATLPFTPISNQQIMASKTITASINDIFGEIDIAQVQKEVARSMCKKIAALLFLSMEEWIDILSMDLPTLKNTLTTYNEKTENILKIIEKEGEDDPQDMSYSDAMILDDEFDIQHLYYASIPTLQQMAKEVVDYYSLTFDISTLELMTRSQLICQIYEFLYMVLEYQGLAKDGVVLCPDIHTIDKVPKNIPSSIQTSPNATRSKNHACIHPIMHHWKKPSKTSRSNRCYSSQ